MKEKKDKLIYKHVLTLSQDVICVWNNKIFIFDKNADLRVEKFTWYIKLQCKTFNDKKKLNTYLSNVENDVIIFLDNNIPDISFKCHDHGDMYRLFSYKKKRRMLSDANIKVVYVDINLSKQLKEKLDYVMEDISQMWAFKLKDPKYYEDIDWKKRLEKVEHWKD